MKINDEVKVGLKEKFIGNAEIGDVIKAHFISSDHIAYYLLTHDTFSGNYAFVDLGDDSNIKYVRSVTLAEIYKSTFVTPEGKPYIDTLEIYKNSVLTIK